MRHCVPLALILVVCTASAALAAPVDSNLAAADNGGGCYPDPYTGDHLFSMLNLVNPEWAPVLNGTVVDSAPVLLHGTVAEVHGQLGGDFPSTHISSDMVAELTLATPDEGRIATGNGAHLAIEWETGALPPFTWPGVGDTATALGRWIFDCGHPGAVPGNCSTTVSQPCLANLDCTPPGCPSCVGGETCVGTVYNYSSEMHPPHAMASVRQGRGYRWGKAATAPTLPVTRADIYVSSFAGGAGDNCVLTHSANYLDLLSVECYPLSAPVAHINEQDFVVDIPMPPRPVGATKLKKKVKKYPIPMGGKRAGMKIEKFGLSDPMDPDYANPFIRVTARMTAAKLPTDFASTIWVGWKEDTTPLQHVRTTVTSLVVNNPVRATNPISPKTCTADNAPCNTTADCGPASFCLGVGTVKGWYMDMHVNGEWQRLTNLDPVDAGQEIPQNLVWDQYLPAGGEVHLLAQGKSQECIDTMYGKSIAQDLNEQGLSKGANCLFSAAREAGDVDATYAGPDFGGGVGGTTMYQTASVGGQGGHCSVTTSTLCVGAADCPMGETCTITGGAFTLKYTIERLP